MRRILLAVTLALSLAGCAGISAVTGVFKTVTETTVPADVVIPAANAFNILKAGATNYGMYCIQQKMVPSICSATTRRVVVRSVRSGTAARNQLEASVTSGQPALSSIYNVLVSAVTSLQTTPASNTQFVENAK